MIYMSTSVFADTTLNLTPENPVISTTPEISGAVEFTIEGQFTNGAEPIVNPSIKCVGENLLDLDTYINQEGNYYERVGSGFKVLNYYQSQEICLILSLKPLTEYSLSLKTPVIARLSIFNEDGSYLFDSGYLDTDFFTFTTESASEYRIKLFSNDANVVISEPMLAEGTNRLSEYKPYIESSYVYDGWLSNGDTLISKKDGTVEVIKNQEHIELDGTLSWKYHFNNDSFKQLRVDNLLLDIGDATSKIAVKDDGDVLKTNRLTALDGGDQIYSVDDIFKNNIYISVSDSDSGWGDSYNPNLDEIKAYFNGWIMYDSITGGLYEGVNPPNWTKKYQGIGSSQTLSFGAMVEFGTGVATCPTIKAYGEDTKTYQLYYQLATPSTETIETSTTINTVGGEKNTISITSDSGTFKSATITVPGLQDLSDKTDEEIHTELLRQITELRTLVLQQQAEIENLKNGGTGTTYDSLKYQYDSNGNLVITSN